MSGDGQPDALVANIGAGTLGVCLHSTALARRAAAPGGRVAPDPARAVLTATGLPADVRTVEATLLSAAGQVVLWLSVPAALRAAQGSGPTVRLAPGVYLLHARALDAQGAVLGPAAPALERGVGGPASETVRPAHDPRCSTGTCAAWPTDRLPLRNHMKAVRQAA